MHDIHSSPKGDAVTKLKLEERHLDDSLGELGKDDVPSLCRTSTVQTGFTVAAAATNTCPPLSGDHRDRKMGRIEVWLEDLPPFEQVVLVEEGLDGNKLGRLWIK